jgi:hypothetical protein
MSFQKVPKDVIFNVVMNYTDPISAHNLCMTNKCFSKKHPKITIQQFLTQIEKNKKDFETSERTHSSANTFYQNLNTIFTDLNSYMTNIPAQKIRSKYIRKLLQKIVSFVRIQINEVVPEVDAWLRLSFFYLASLPATQNP